MKRLLPQLIIQHKAVLLQRCPVVLPVCGVEERSARSVDRVLRACECVPSLQTASGSRIPLCANECRLISIWIRTRVHVLEGVLAHVSTDSDMLTHTCTRMHTTLESLWWWKKCPQGLNRAGNRARIPDSVTDTTHCDLESREQHSRRRLRFSDQILSLYLCVRVCVCVMSHKLPSISTIHQVKGFVLGLEGKVFYLHLWVCCSKVEGVNKKKWRRDFTFKGEDGFVHLFISF